MRWPFGRSYEARSLNRDARYIVDDAEARFPPERLRALAERLGAYLDEAHARLERSGMTHDNVLLDLQRLHREAKRQRQDMLLSALTLAIIQLRAERLGEECAPALEAIEALRAAHGSQNGGGGEPPTILEA